MLLFESSWEVCNKVGGIYTVLATKIKYAKNFSEEYVCLGPYFKKSNFLEKDVPDTYKSVFASLRKKGITCHYGFWDTAGTPETILFDFKELWASKNNIKTLLWERFGVDSLFSSFEFEEPVLFSWAVGMFLEEVRRKFPNKEIVSHFHEWMSGVSLLYLEIYKIKLPTVFTTHATMLGRTLSSNNRYFLDSIEKIDALTEARNFNIQDKHLVEKACAENCSVFCTVSEITSKECFSFFGRKPDYITYNGVDLSLFSNKKEFKDNVIISKEMLRTFVTQFFFKHYAFDLDKTTFIFTSGRYEFHDKGTDSFIKSLSLLNNKLIESNSDKTAIVFFLMPVRNYGLKKDILSPNFGSSIGGFPPISSHYIDDESNDLIVKNLLKEGLNNSKEKRVKNIFIPIYLSEEDLLFNKNYYDVISGFDLGVFPSAYEPWGYTPLECSALAIPSITSNLAGFGLFVEKYLKKNEEDGVFIVDRNKENFTEDLSEIIFSIIKKDSQERERNRISANALATRATWKLFYKKYEDSYRKALSTNFI